MLYEVNLIYNFTCCIVNQMEQSITDFWKDTFPDFEHVHFGDDTETANSDEKPEREAAMEDNNNQDEDRVSWSDLDLDLVKTQSMMNTEMEVKTATCSRNSKDGLLDEQSLQTGSLLYGSWDALNSVQAEDQQLSLHEEQCKKELKIHADQMTKEQAHVQVEDVRFLEKVPEMVVEEKTSHLQPFQMSDNPEDKSSSSEDEITDPEGIEERASKNAKDVDPTMSIDVQSRDDMKEFTEDDHVREEEGLADYPSDLSQSEDEDSDKSHEEEPSHVNTKLGEKHLQTDEEHRFCLMENQDITSRDGDGTRNSMNPVDANIKNDLDVDVCDSNADKDNSSIGNTVERVDSEIFQAIALLDENSEGYTNEEPDNGSDSSSDEDYMRKKFLTSHEQENTLAKDIVESEEEDIEDTDSQNVEICDAGGLSGIPAFPKAGMVDSSSSAYSLHSSETPNIVVSHLESNEVKNIGESLNQLLPEEFWSLNDKDSLKLDEYDWDVHGDEVICDEEDEDENEEEMKRDWEKDLERIDAFNTYYKSSEDEENVCRSHKVTFCLEPISTLYEEEYSSSDEELNTNISELHPAEPSSALHQSNDEHNSQTLDAEENIYNVQPEILWSPTILMDEDDVELNEYDYDLQGEDFKKRNSTEVSYDETVKLFLEEQMNDGQEVKRDLRQEQARTEVFDRCNRDREVEVPDTSHSFMFMDQESSQTEDNESSEHESNTEEDTSIRKIEDQSDSDEPQSSTQCFYLERHRLPKHFQKLNKTQKEPKSKCLVLLKTILAVSLGTAVGVLSYWLVTDSLDWIF